MVELHLGQGSGSVVFGGGGAVPMVFWASFGCVWLLSDGILGLSVFFLFSCKREMLEMFSRLEGFSLLSKGRCSRF